MMSQRARRGVLLIQLGTPASADVKTVRQYLAEFLNDPRVVDCATWLRKILLYAVILPFRPRKTAKAYAKIFDSTNGSPLRYHSEALREAMQCALGSDYVVALGMRYGEPRLQDVVDGMLAKGCQEIMVIPLFPQYSSAVTGSAIEALLRIIQTKNNIPSLMIQSEFYQQPGYQAISASFIRHALQNMPEATVVFSYHGLPVRQIRRAGGNCGTYCLGGESDCVLTDNNTTCYRAKCFETSRALAELLGLERRQYEVAFQSRLGRLAWIGPDLETVFEQLIGKGVKKLIVVCPSFVVDCLETLEEVGIRAKEDWYRRGGEAFYLVPCLNAQEEWVAILSNWVRKTLAKKGEEDGASLRRRA